MTERQRKQAEHYAGIVSLLHSASFMTGAYQVVNDACDKAHELGIEIAGRGTKFGDTEKALAIVETINAEWHRRGHNFTVESFLRERVELPVSASMCRVALDWLATKEVSKTN